MVPSVDLYTAWFSCDVIVDKDEKTKQSPVQEMMMGQDSQTVADRMDPALSSEDSEGGGSDVETPVTPSDKMHFEAILERAVPVFISEDDSSDDDDGGEEQKLEVRDQSLSHDSLEGLSDDNEDAESSDYVDLKTGIDGTEHKAVVDGDILDFGDGVEIIEEFSPASSDNEDDKDSTTSGEYDISTPPFSHEYFQIQHREQRDDHKNLTTILEDAEQNESSTAEITGSDKDTEEVMNEEMEQEKSSASLQSISPVVDKAGENLQVDEHVVASKEPTLEAGLPTVIESVTLPCDSDDEAQPMRSLERCYPSTTGSTSSSSDNDTDTQGAEEYPYDDSFQGKDENSNLPKRGDQDQTILDRLPKSTGDLLLDVIASTDKPDSNDDDDDEDDDNDVFLDDNWKVSPYADKGSDSENDYSDLMFKDSVIESDYELLLLSGGLPKIVVSKQTDTSSSSGGGGGGDDDDDYQDLVKEEVRAPSPSKAIAYSEFLQQTKRMLEEDEPQDEVVNDSDRLSESAKEDDKEESLSPQENWESFTASLEAKHTLGMVQITKKEEVVIHEDVLEWKEPRISTDEEILPLETVPKELDAEEQDGNEEGSAHVSDKSFHHPKPPSAPPSSDSDSEERSIKYAEILPGSYSTNIDISLSSTGHEKSLPRQDEQYPDCESDVQDIVQESRTAPLQSQPPPRLDSTSSSDSEGNKRSEDRVDDNANENISDELVNETNLPSDMNFVDENQVRPMSEGPCSEEVDKDECTTSETPNCNMEKDDAELTATQEKEVPLYKAEIVIPIHSSPLEKQFPDHSSTDSDTDNSKPYVSNDQTEETSLSDRVVIIDLGPNVSSPISSDNETDNEVSLGVVSITDTVYPSVETDGERSEYTIDVENFPRYVATMEKTSPAHQLDSTVHPIETACESPEVTIHQSYLEWTEPLQSPPSSEEKDSPDGNLVGTLGEDLSSDKELDNMPEQQPVIFDEFISISREECYTISLEPKAMHANTIDNEVCEKNNLDSDTTSKESDDEEVMYSNLNDDPLNQTLDDVVEQHLEEDQPETALSEPEIFISAVKAPVEEVSVDPAVVQDSSSDSGSVSPVMLELRLPSSTPDADDPDSQYVTVKVRVEAPKPRSVQVFFEEPHKQREVFAVHQKKHKGSKTKPRSSGTQVSLDDSDMPDSLLECSVDSDVSYPFVTASGDVHFATTPTEDNSALGASFVLDITDPQQSSGEEVEDIKSDSLISSTPIRESVICATDPLRQSKVQRGNVDSLLEEYDDSMQFKDPETLDTNLQNEKDARSECPAEETTVTMTQIAAPSSNIAIALDDDVPAEHTDDIRSREHSPSSHELVTQSYPLASLPVHIIGPNDVEVQITLFPMAQSTPERSSMGNLLQEYEEDLQFQEPDPTNAADDVAKPVASSSPSRPLVEEATLAPSKVEMTLESEDLEIKLQNLGQTSFKTEESESAECSEVEEHAPENLKVADLPQDHYEEEMLTAGVLPVEARQTLVEETPLHESPLTSSSITIYTEYPMTIDHLEDVPDNKLEVSEPSNLRESIDEEQFESQIVKSVHGGEESEQPEKVPMSSLLEEYDEDIHFRVVDDGEKMHELVASEVANDSFASSPIREVPVISASVTEPMTKETDEKNKKELEDRLKQLEVTEPEHPSRDRMQEEIVVVTYAKEDEQTPERASLTHLLQEYDDAMHLDSMSSHETRTMDNTDPDGLDSKEEAPLPVAETPVTLSSMETTESSVVDLHKILENKQDSTDQIPTEEPSPQEIAKESVVTKSVEGHGDVQERKNISLLLQEYDDDIKFDVLDENEEQHQDVQEPILSGSEVRIEEQVLECRRIDPNLESCPGEHGSPHSDEGEEDVRYSASQTISTEIERDVVTISRLTNIKSSNTVTTDTTIQYSMESYSETVISESTYERQRRPMTLDLDEDEADAIQHGDERYPSFFTPTKSPTTSFEDANESIDINKSFDTDKPHFAQELCDLVVDVGDMAILQCHIGGDPMPEVKWFKNGFPLEPNDHLSIQVLQFKDLYVELVIDSVTLDDTGAYTAEATNEHGYASSSAFVMVREATDSEDEEDLAVAGRDAAGESSSSGSENFHSAEEDGSQEPSESQDHKTNQSSMSTQLSNDADQGLDLQPSTSFSNTPNLTPLSSPNPSSDTPFTPCPGLGENKAITDQGLSQEPSSSFEDVVDVPAGDEPLHVVSECLDIVPTEEQDLHEPISQGLRNGSKFC